MLWQDYHLPTSVGEARVVAGDTDPILEIQQGHRPPVKALVDVTLAAGRSGAPCFRQHLELSWP
jgi:hypothetical protein